jgi:S1-C subfamily serine protease
MGAQYCFKCGSRVGKVVTEEFSVSSDDLVKKVKDLLHEGNVTRITAGLIGVILAPWLAALGAIAALVTECTISVERRE